MGETSVVLRSSRYSENGPVFALFFLPNLDLIHSLSCPRNTAADMAATAAVVSILACGAPALSMSGQPVTQWTKDLSHLGQDIWTLAYGTRSDLIFASAEWGGLAALEPTTGRTVWETRVPGIARAELAEVGGGSGDGSSGILIISGQVGLDAATGKVLWNRTATDHARHPFGAAHPGLPAHSAALPSTKTELTDGSQGSESRVDSSGWNGAGEVAVTTAGLDVLLYDVETGKPHWRATKVLHTIPCGASLVGSMVVVATIVNSVGPPQPAELVVLSVSTGSVLWRSPLGAGLTCSGSTNPVISLASTAGNLAPSPSRETPGGGQPMVLVGTASVDNNGGMAFGAVVGFNAKTGAKVWSAKTRQGAGVTTVSLAAQSAGSRVAYYGDTRGGTFAVDVATGQPAGRLISTAAGVLTPMVQDLNNSLVLFGGNFAPDPFYTSGIFALDASGQQAWAWKAPGGSLSNRLAFGRGLLFAATLYGNSVVALKIR